jgi:hypothetical protein
LEGLGVSHFFNGEMAREVALDLGLPENARKVLRTNATCFECEREVKSRPNLGRWTADHLDEMLARNNGPRAVHSDSIFKELPRVTLRGGDDLD